MKIFKQTIVFILILAAFLLGRQSLIAADYTGINLPEGIENKLNNDVNLINPNSLNTWDSNDAGVKYISGAVYYVIETLKGVLYAFALVYIIIAGVRIVTAQGDENTIKSNKDSIVFALFGFIIILIADVAVREVFYGEGYKENGIDYWPGSCLLNPSECATKGSAEILGIVKWGKDILALIAVLEIIISGVRMIMAIGAEDIIEKEKKVFVWVGIGLLLLAIDTVVINKVLYIVDEDTGIKSSNGRLDVDANLQNGINEFVGVIQFILQFVGIMALASLIYGGFLMVMNFGDDEKVTKAKGIIRDAIIGIIVAISAYAIVSTIIFRAN